MNNQPPHSWESSGGSWFPYPPGFKESQKCVARRTSCVIFLLHAESDRVSEKLLKVYNLTTSLWLHFGSFNDTSSDQHRRLRGKRVEITEPRILKRFELKTSTAVLDHKSLCVSGKLQSATTTPGVLNQFKHYHRWWNVAALWDVVTSMLPLSLSMSDHCVLLKDDDQSSYKTKCVSLLEKCPCTRL